MKENLMQRKRRYLLTPKKELAERCLLIEQELNKLHSIIKEAREEIRILVTNSDIADYQAQKLFQILDKVEEK